MFFSSYTIAQTTRHHYGSTENQTHNQTAKIEFKCFCGILNLFGMFKLTENEKTNTMQRDDINKLQYALCKKINCLIEIFNTENRINILMPKSALKNFKTCCKLSNIPEKNISIMKNNTETSWLSDNYIEIKISQKNAKNLLSELNTGTLVNCTFNHK